MRSSSTPVGSYPAWLTKRDSRGWNGTMSITRLTSGLAALVTTLALASQRAGRVVQAICIPAGGIGLPVLCTGGRGHVRRRSRRENGLVCRLRSRVHERVSDRTTRTTLSNKMGDFTWGNRFEIGYVDDDQKGWVVHRLAHRRSERKRRSWCTERLNRVRGRMPIRKHSDLPAADNNNRVDRAAATTWFKTASTWPT